MEHTTTPLLAPWMRALHAEQLLRLGAARPDGYSSLTWRSSSPSDDTRTRWLRLRLDQIHDPVRTVQVVEFVLLAQKLHEINASLCDEQVLQWLADQGASTSSNVCSVVSPIQRFEDPCCVGGCRLPGANDLSMVSRSKRHTSPHIMKRKVLVQPHDWRLGIVVDVDDDTAEFFTLLHRLSSSHSKLLAESCLSDTFKATYCSLLETTGSCTSTVRLHLRLASPTPSSATLHGVLTTLTKWEISPVHSFTIQGLDVAAESLHDFLVAAPALPFRQLSVCASASKASRYDPLATPSKPLDDALLKLLFAKSRGVLEELQLCNVQVVNLDCVVQSYNVTAAQDTANRVRKLRLGEFSMGVVIDSGIFGALQEPSHLLYQTLEELEIRQASHSAGGLSFWLEREAGAMLLKNDRLTKCVIHQACSMYPSMTHKGFAQTRGRQIRLPVPASCRLAFLAAIPIKLPREIAHKILEMAERQVPRDAQMHYEPIGPDQLPTFERDCDAWKPKQPMGMRMYTSMSKSSVSLSSSSSLSYGSYYF